MPYSSFVTASGAVAGSRVAVPDTWLVQPATTSTRHNAAALTTCDVRIDAPSVLGSDAQYAAISRHEASPVVSLRATSRKGCNGTLLSCALPSWQSPSSRR